MLFETRGDYEFSEAVQGSLRTIANSSKKSLQDNEANQQLIKQLIDTTKAQTEQMAELNKTLSLLVAAVSR